MQLKNITQLLTNFSENRPGHKFQSKQENAENTLRIITKKKKSGTSGKKIYCP